MRCDYQSTRPVRYLWYDSLWLCQSTRHVRHMCTIVSVNTLYTWHQLGSVIANLHVRYVHTGVSVNTSCIRNIHTHKKIDCWTGLSHCRNSWSKCAEWRPLAVHPKVPNTKHFDGTEKQDMPRCATISCFRKGTKGPDRKATPFIGISSECLCHFKS